MTELRLNRFGERVMIAGSGCAVLGGVVAFDETVRGRLDGMLHGNAFSELTTAGQSLHRVIRTTSEAAGYHGTQDTPLLIFTVAAVVLLGLMLKT